MVFENVLLINFRLLFVKIQEQTITVCSLSTFTLILALEMPNDINWNLLKQREQGCDCLRPNRLSKQFLLFFLFLDLFCGFSQATEQEKSFKRNSWRRHISELSDEILERILRKLPITTLIECRYACKSWRDISHFGKLQFLTGDPQCPYPLDRKKRKRSSLRWI